MVHETETTHAPDEVLDRAIRFFGERVPHSAAFPEKRGEGYLLLRGQGGEEIAVHASREGERTRVRIGTLLFDHAVGRFLSTLGAGVTA